VLNDEDNEKARFYRRSPATPSPPMTGLLCSEKENLGAALVISGGVAIHALSLRVVARGPTFGGHRNRWPAGFHSRSWPVRHCLPLLAVRQSAPEQQNLSSVEEVPSEIAN